MQYYWTDETKTNVIRVDEEGHVVAYFPGDDGYDDAKAQAKDVAPTIGPSARNVREQRDALLVASDWTQLPDAPVDADAWASYRQALRDLPDQGGFPSSVNWPEEPS